MGIKLQRHTVSRTGHLAGTRVHAELEPLFVQTVRYRLESIGKLFGFRLQLAVLVAPALLLPAVVQDDILIPQVAEPQADELL